MVSDESKEKVIQIIQEFIDDNNISCAEAIAQNDRVIENAYTFIYELCEIVGYKEYQD